MPDLHLIEHGGAWLAEACEGGADSESRWFELASEDMALDCGRDLTTLSRMDGWKELLVGIQGNSFDQGCPGDERRHPYLRS